MIQGRSWTRQQLAALRRVLADLFPRETEQRKVVKDLGLRAAIIGFEPSAESTWFNILQRAEQTVGVEAVLRFALASDEGRGNPDLLRLDAGVDLAPLPAPDIKAVRWQGPGGAAKNLEKILGSVSTLVSVSFLALGLERARSVALVKKPDRTSGSGFLIKLPGSVPGPSEGTDLFVTNHHVLGSVDEARSASLFFDFEHTASGLAREPTKVALAPERFFAASEQDDWAVTATEPGTVARWGAISLGSGKGPLVGSRVNIIQHPGGGEKKLSYLANEVVYVGGDRVQYLTDTEPGSSGSPVFDMQWRLVALHHSGGYLPEPGSSPGRTFLRNEGIAIEAIVRGLAVGS